MRMTDAAVTTGVAPTGRAWIARPWVDLVIGCGGWSLPLLLVAYATPVATSAGWSSAFYSLALVANYPHYMATIYRAYGRADFRAHRLWTVYGTAVLVALAAAAHVRLALLPWLFTAYVMWSPWHYTGQNFGLLMMFLRRGGQAVTPGERRWLRGAFIASYVMLLVTFNRGTSSDPLVLSLGLGPAVASLATAVAASAFVIGAGWGFFMLWRRGPRRALLAPAILVTTQALWFVVPTALSWAAGIGVPQTRYSSGILAVMHAFQYLWITQHFARREQGAAWSAGRYWLAIVAGGMALFVPIPWLASYVGHVDFTASMLIVASVVNLQHFMLDGVVWKLRDKRVSQALIESAPSAPAAPATFAGPRPAVRLITATALAVLIALVGLDQWRYRLASRQSDAAALEEALRLNPFDDRAEARLLQALVSSGRNEDARIHLDALLASRPGDVDVLVNAGVLAQRTSRTDDAVRYWERALRRDPQLAHVELYLADLLLVAHRAPEAVPHYRRYLELVVAQRARVKPDPVQVVPAVLRFGDALASVGETTQARTQYDLAIRMSGQTGLRELESAARQRLAQLPP